MSPVQHSCDAEARTPPLSLLFGYGAMLPLAALAVAAWMLPLRLAAFAVAASVVWAARSSPSWAACGAA